MTRQALIKNQRLLDSVSTSSHGTWEGHFSSKLLSNVFIFCFPGRFRTGIGKMYEHHSERMEMDIHVSLLTTFALSSAFSFKKTTRLCALSFTNIADAKHNNFVQASFTRRGLKKTIVNDERRENDVVLAKNLHIIQDI